MPLFQGKHILIGEDGAPFFDKTKKVSFIADGQFWVNNHCHVLKARSNCVDEYVAYCLNAVDYTNYIKGSTRDKLNQSDLSSIDVPWPSICEQNAIAAFLDRKTAQIDQAVAIKEQQIALLKERKQILIQNAVTRRSASGTVHGPEQALTLDEALQAHTINAAWQQKREREIGSIEVGKLADLVALNTDPYTVDPTRLQDTMAVHGTWLAGRRVRLDDFMASVKALAHRYDVTLLGAAQPHQC